MTVLIRTFLALVFYGSMVDGTKSVKTDNDEVLEVVNEMKLRMIALEADNADMKQRIHVLETDNTKIQLKMSTDCDRIRYLEKCYRNSTKNNSNFTFEIETTNIRIHDLEKQGMLFKNVFNAIKRSSSSDQRTHPEANTKMTKRVPETIVGSAFFVRPSTAISNLLDNQHLIFDHVTTTVGSDYDAAQGVFTCSLPGTYVFHHTIRSYPGKWVETAIVKDDIPFAFVFARSDTTWGTGSASAVINLKKGDKVWIKISSNWHSTDSDNAIEAVMSYFSGFLLYPQEL